MPILATRHVVTKITVSFTIVDFVDSCLSLRLAMLLEMRPAARVLDKLVLPGRLLYGFKTTEVLENAVNRLLEE